LEADIVNTHAQATNISFAGLKHSRGEFINCPPATNYIGVRLPQRIVCSGCKEILYEGDLLKSPQDIIKKYEGKCPHCKKALKFTTEGVDVRPTG